MDLIRNEHSKSIQDSKLSNYFVHSVWWVMNAKTCGLSCHF